MTQKLVLCRIFDREFPIRSGIPEQGSGRPAGSRATILRTEKPPGLMNSPRRVFQRLKTDITLHRYYPCHSYGIGRPPRRGLFVPKNLHYVVWGWGIPYPGVS